MQKTDINEAKLGGARRKNGHKKDCSCHICENMRKKAQRGGYEEDIKNEQEKLLGGSKKKNGHKKDCMCPICKNMQNASKTRTSKKSAGKRKTKKGNGHKPDCKCPICKNMRKKGGDSEPASVETSIEDEEPTSVVDEELTSVKEPTNVKEDSTAQPGKEIEAKDVEYDQLDRIQSAGKKTKKRRRLLKKRKTRRI